MGKLGEPIPKSSLSVASETEGTFQIPPVSTCEPPVLGRSWSHLLSPGSPGRQGTLRPSQQAFLNRGLRVGGSQDPSTTHLVGIKASALHAMAPKCQHTILQTHWKNGLLALYHPCTPRISSPLPQGTVAAPAPTDTDQPTGVLTDAGCPGWLPKRQ